MSFGSMSALFSKRGGSRRRFRSKKNRRSRRSRRYRGGAGGTGAAGAAMTNENMQTRR
jgi:hypothetical protein